MGIPQPQYNEFCIECGNFVDHLNERTGWCYSCSVKSGEIAPSCPYCGSETVDGKLCGKCKYELWLKRNADKIEATMAVRSVSVRIAKKLVLAENRPICHSCHEPIKGGMKGRSLFCMKHPECVKAHNAYSYHSRNKPHKEALVLAITASVIYKLTANISQTASG